EHLAVLLPRHLWKPDSDASSCDAFPCAKRFSFRERRHHCRKCGGVFCQTCSSRSTPLLDTTTLPFINPPRNTPLIRYASPEAPLLPARVCDDCYNQIHGIPRKPLPVPDSVDTASPKPSPKSPRRRRRSPLSSLPPPPPTPVEFDLPPDLAELATYPLRHPSAICKATGGGRWVPTPPPDAATRRFPGRKPAYEILLDEEERAARRLWENPVITDGPFRMRKP
ncbi:FYVE zinc finger-domain-containing protein, partial [Amylostereum chailletii]